MASNDDEGAKARPGAEDPQTASGAARRETRQFVDAVKDRARSLLDEQKGMVAEEISGTARVLRHTVDGLKQEDHTLAARYADRAASGLDQLSHMVREREMGSLLDDVQDFARRQPVLFFGGAVATGFLLARFLKSSGEHYESGQARRGMASGYAGTQPRGPGNGPAGRTTGAGGVLDQPGVPPGTSGGA